MVRGREANQTSWKNWEGPVKKNVAEDGLQGMGGKQDSELVTSFLNYMILLQEFWYDV